MSCLVTNTGVVAGEIPNYDWGKPVRDSPHLGLPNGKWALEAVATIVTVFLSKSEHGGAYLGFIAVTDADEVIKFWMEDAILGFKPGAVIWIHGTEWYGVTITRHDVNTKGGVCHTMKSTVLRDLEPDDVTLLRKRPARKKRVGS